MNITHLICKKCEDFVFSFYRHDFQFCKCGACGLDGGMDYNRMIGNPEDRIVVESDIETVIGDIRKKMSWTQNYDKWNERLKTPITRKLNKLKTDHILGILLYFTRKLIPYEKDYSTGEINGSVPDKSWITIHEIFLEELRFRNKIKK